MSDKADLRGDPGGSLGKSEKLTDRGFVAPDGIIEQLGHRFDRFFIVRMTLHEARQTRIMDSGIGIRLLPREDGTYDGIAFPPQDSATAEANPKEIP